MKVVSATKCVNIAPSKMQCALLLIIIYTSGHFIAPATWTNWSPDTQDVARAQREIRVDAFLTSQVKQLEEIREGNDNLHVNVALDEYVIPGADFNFVYQFYSLRQSF